jgi:hypothetical protein
MHDSKVQKKGEEHTIFLGDVTPLRIPKFDFHQYIQILPKQEYLS